MAGIGNTDAAPPSLSQLFLRGWEARRKVDACELTSGSPEHLVRAGGAGDNGDITLSGYSVCGDM